MDTTIVSIASLKTSHQNLAYEEWLFEHFETTSLRLWLNPPSVVVGKHQNAMSECNAQYCLANDIPMIRRISGGGTVYHDLGNVNFSFFRYVSKDKLIDYDSGLGLIEKALQHLGYPVQMNERHDLYLGDLKVSGNAQHVRKGRSLHHGTILYDANLDQLRASIKRSNGTFEDKAVRSVRSPIGNLREHLDLGEPEDFISSLQRALIDLGATEGELPIDHSEIDRLARDKYSLETWNFGYSPSYIYRNEEKDLILELQVARGGLIEKASVVESGKADKTIEDQLIGLNHYPEEMRSFASGHERIKVILY